MAHASAHVQRDLRALWRKRRQTPQCGSLQRLRIGARRSDRSGGRSPHISCRRCWPLRSTGSTSRWRPPPLTRSWMLFFVIRGSNAAATSAYSRSRRFAYDYDFGSTTRLTVERTGARVGRIGKHSVRLLVRNDPLPWKCGVCGAPAALVCCASVTRSRPGRCRNDTARRSRAPNDDAVSVPQKRPGTAGPSRTCGPPSTDYCLPFVRSLEVIAGDAF